MAAIALRRKDFTERLLGEPDEFEDVLRVLYERNILSKPLNRIEELTELSSREIIILFDRCLFPTLSDSMTLVADRIAAFVQRRHSVQLPNLGALDDWAKYLNKNKFVNKQWFEYEQLCDGTNWFIPKPVDEANPEETRLRRVAFEAVKHGKVNLLAYLLLCGAGRLLYSIGKQDDCFSATLLHLAAAYGQRDVVEFLVDSGMDVNTMGNFRGVPLEMALGLCDELLESNIAEKDRLAVAHFLRSRGAYYFMDLVLKEDLNDVSLQLKKTTPASWRRIEEWPIEFPLQNLL